MAEALADAPIIAAETEYLVGRGEINGFSGQLKLGFSRRVAGE